MNIWASRFGQEGVNLAIDNSFRLQVTNASTSPFTLNLFNLGGSSNTQTPISTGEVSQNLGTSNVLIFPLLNGVATLNYTFQLRFNATILVSVNMLAGSTIADLMAAVPSVTNLQGQTGSFFIQSKPNDLTGKLYDIIVTIPNVNIANFITIVPATQSTQPLFNVTQTYAANNPFITFRSNKNTNLNLIQNSEIGNSYKIIGMDVYSENASQVLEPLNYFYRDANGNLQGALSPPTISPYQPNQASLQMVYVDNFQITTNTQFQYIINGLTDVYLTYNYVNFGVNDFREFGQIFYQQTRDVFMMDKKLVEMSRIQSLNVE